MVFAKGPLLSRVGRLLMALGLTFAAAGFSAPALDPSLKALEHSLEMPKRVRETSLAQRIAWMVDRLETERKNRKEARDSLLQAHPFEEMSFIDLRRYFQELDDSPLKRSQRGLAEIGRILEQGPGQNNGRNRMMEIADALENNFRPRLPQGVSLVSIPFLYFDYAHNPILKGRVPASNLSTDSVPYRADPRPGSFWKRPDRISEQNLEAGFDRSSVPSYADRIWEYSHPKTSSGSNPGFELAEGKSEIKVKFGETHSEPFAARLFHALGYHVDPTDYTPYLKIRYSRRLFREFHLRQDLKMSLALFGVMPAGAVHLQHRFSFFDFIDHAVLKDGQRLSGPAFRTALLVDARRPSPEDDPANFNTDLERRIACLVTKPANIQPRMKGESSVGPWRFDALEHENRREVRAAGLLAAWIGWFDSRFDNTRLKLIPARGGTEPVHFFSDLGGCLGKSDHALTWHGEDLEKFTDSFTRLRGRRIQIVHFRPLDDTLAFKEMTGDDALWMAGLIEQVSEKQLRDALRASGFAPREIDGFAGKLLSRRRKMLEDLRSARALSTADETHRRTSSVESAPQGPAR